MAERVLLVGKGSKTGIADTVQHVKKTRIAGKISPQHQRIQHVADKVYCLFRITVGRDGRAHDEIFLAGIAPKENIQSGKQRHEGRSACFAIHGAQAAQNS